MKAIIFLTVISCLWPRATQGADLAVTGSIVSRPSEPPRRNFYIIYYDSSYLFTARHYGDHRDPGGNTEPGLFVHSKAGDCWLQISAVATRGGKFGKSSPTDPDEQKRLNGISISWDFTSLVAKEFAELPLKTSGSIDFPDVIEDDELGQQYRLHFNSRLGIASAETVLVVKKADVETAFKANRFCQVNR